jgi:hypothetical protein
MIKVVKETTLEQIESATGQARPQVVSGQLLIIAVTDGHEHYELFEQLVKGLKLEVEEKVK